MLATVDFRERNTADSGCEVVGSQAEDFKSSQTQRVPDTNVCFAFKLVEACYLAGGDRDLVRMNGE